MLLAGLTLAAFAAAYLSAAIGIGGGTLFIVLLYLMLPPQLALPLHGAVQVINNGARLAAFRHAVLWRVARPFLLAVLPAVGVGWVLLGLLDADLLKGLLGLYVLVSVVVPPGAHQEPSAKGWFGLGTGASLSSMLVGAADPVIAPFFLSERYRREEVIATKAICQLSTHIPKVALFVFLGQQSFEFSYAEHTRELLAMGVAVIVGVVVGKKTTVSDKNFRRVYRGLLAVLGLKLIVDCLLASLGTA